MPLRVLQIVTTMNRGGLETMLMNYYRHIDRKKVQFDFLVHRQEEGDYEKEIMSLGGRVFRVPALNPFSPTYFKALDSFFTEHKYDIVHCHLDCMSAIPLYSAKKHGVKHRFAHAHNKSQDKDLKYPFKLFYKRFIPYFANELFACGEEAGRWMFNGKKFTVINNAIDASHYSFSEDLREIKRRELGLNNYFTVCHIGRFNPQKNHSFIIDIFYELLKIEPNAHLLLVGTGDGLTVAKNKVADLKLDSKVSFLGVRADITELLNAADAFLFPSLYEGLGIAGIEAQASGLPCFFSDRIPDECKVTDDVEFISLEKSPAYWAEKIYNGRRHIRSNNYEQIKNAGYDISSNAFGLQNLYLSKGVSGDE
ncbi:MAG: glycosyltransferase family 1 protein [Clostridia bacterium]|nr:glycosyltransferase family 1 protein [Clostridia bacterium]